MILRDESDSEEEQVQVHASEPVTIEAETLVFQKETESEGSTPQISDEAESSGNLKRKRTASSDAQATPSLARRLKKMRATRHLAKPPSEDTVEAEERDQESLISKEPIIIESLPETKDTVPDKVLTPTVSPIKATDDAEE